MAKQIDIAQDPSLLNGSSYLHLMDPRLKVLASFILALSVALTRDWGSLVLLLGLSTLLVFWSRIPLTKVIRRLAAFDSVLIILWLTLPFSAGGEKVYLGGVSIYAEGIKLALAITLRSNAAFLGFLALLGTTPIHENLKALRALGIPHKLVLLLHFTYRYGHVLMQEAIKVQQAMALRGFQPGFNLFTMKTYGNFVGVIFLKAFKRAERVTQAMVLRGFEGTFPELAAPKRMSFKEVASCAVLCLLFWGCTLV
ncbi:cobalt ABC transporter, inner membrane subunit CbiQ [Thermovirga lienii DSM 17291]|jgi:cobalt/nickel transport system permease protein|uniref:Cobalt ABC transporter, inner membrane subunit CbiQ n=1 Tax=Thermovirga lienii (strain ATCC BAA-1197 / DSM 17291 / Cas60314) TaxID=580340 RepID=G7V834_THELD|nr:cobalt ECF transporter T component CbiQ [Thermovirga lienii]AER67365.1 cobalt ABC transporter, inner membrane subunit CbiQ [Thermovirga lienii DSM 17291]MDN5319540.1 cobalt/nickel transport system permease protein [Thermovirga sp.]